MTSRRLSVVMPVYNAMPYLNASIESIVNQRFDDFEFIIGDDASTDGSSEVLADWARKDDRIKLYRAERNLGPVGSSNWVVSKATSPIVARMDADDEAHPDRLLRQFEVLQQHPDIGLLGTLAESIDDDGQVVVPADRSQLLRSSVFAPFAHGSIMYRRSLFDQVGGYRETCAFWEDLDLFLRFRRVTKVAVVASTLYRFRYAMTSARFRLPEDKLAGIIDLMLRCANEAANGRSYENILAPCNSSSRDRKLLPLALVLVGAERLWRGFPVGVLGLMWRRAAIRADVPTAKALLWALWASASPASMLWFWKLRKRALNSAAHAKVQEGQVYHWPLETSNGS